MHNFYKLIFDMEQKHNRVIGHFLGLHRLAYNAAWKRAGTVSSHLKSFCFKHTAANKVYRKQGGGWAEVNGKWSQNKKIT